MPDRLLQAALWEAARQEEVEMRALYGGSAPRSPEVKEKSTAYLEAYYEIASELVDRGVGIESDGLDTIRVFVEATRAALLKKEKEEADNVDGDTRKS